MKRVDRYQLENASIPTRPYASESIESDLLDNFDTLRILVSTLGFPFLDEVKAPKNAELLTVKGKE